MLFKSNQNFWAPKWSIWVCACTVSGHSVLFYNYQSCLTLEITLPLPKTWTLKSLIMCNIIVQAPGLWCSFTQKYPINTSLLNHQSRARGYTWAQTAYKSTWGRSGLFICIMMLIHTKHPVNNSLPDNQHVRLSYSTTLSRQPASPPTSVLVCGKFGRVN